MQNWRNAQAAVSLYCGLLDRDVCRPMKHDVDLNRNVVKVRILQGLRKEKCRSVSDKCVSVRGFEGNGGPKM